MFRLDKEIMDFCGDMPSISNNVDRFDFFIYAQEIIFANCYPTAKFDSIREIFEEKYNAYFFGKNIEPEKQWWVFHLIASKLIADSEELVYASAVIDFLLKKSESLKVEEIKSYVNEITFTYFKTYIPFLILRPKMIVEQNSSIRRMSDVSKNIEKLLRDSKKIIEEEVDFQGFKGEEFPPIFTDLYKVEKGLTTMPELLAELFVICIADGVYYLVENIDKESSDFDYILGMIEYFVEEIGCISGCKLQERLTNLMKNTFGKV